MNRLRPGERRVRFEFCYSVLLATVHRQSPAIVTSSRLDRYWRGVGYSILTLLLGPWGIPWGPILTARAVWVNLTGGEDATDAMPELGDEGSRGNESETNGDG